MTYRQLTLEERYRIAALRALGWCPAVIARALGRARSTITGERARSRTARGRYEAYPAHCFTRTRRTVSGRNRRVTPGDWAVAGAARRARRAPAWLLEHPEGSGPVAGEIAVHPDDAPGAVEPASQIAHRLLTRRQNPERAYATAIEFRIPSIGRSAVRGGKPRRSYPCALRPTTSSSDSYDFANDTTPSTSCARTASRSTATAFRPASVARAPSRFSAIRSLDAP